MSARRKKSAGLQAIEDGQKLRQVLAGERSTSNVQPTMVGKAEATGPADTLTAMIDRCFREESWMVCAPVEANDGILIGGLIVVRGEREYELLKAFLRSHCKAPEAVLPVLEKTDQGSTESHPTSPSKS